MALLILFGGLQLFIFICTKGRFLIIFKKYIVINP